MVLYQNRIGAEHYFSLAEDGNVLWEGNFDFCRVGYPNDYKAAYQQYRKDCSDMQIDYMFIETFEKAVHEYDSEKGYSPLAKRYGKLVTSDKNTITMVDPSGGPYLAKGMMFRYIEGHERTILGFEKIDEHSWKIILDDMKWMEDRKIVGGII